MTIHILQSCAELQTFFLYSIFIKTIYFSINHTQSLAEGFIGGSVMADDSDFTDSDDESNNDDDGGNVINKLLSDVDQE